MRLELGLVNFCFLTLILIILLLLFGAVPRIVFVFVDVGGVVICVMSVCSVLCTLGPGWGPALSPHLYGLSCGIYLRTIFFLFFGY